MSTATTALVHLRQTSAYLAPLLKKVKNVKLVKLLFWIIVLVNIRASPFVWHLRLFRPAYYIFAEYIGISVKTIFHSRKAKKAVVDRWVEGRSQIGMSPFEYAGKWTSSASLDECDYNFHLSNSSYPKALDKVRFKNAMELFPQLFRFGGYIAIAGTHFNFIREIPILANYEVRGTIAAWDEKWFYAVYRFVTKPKGKKKRSSQHHKIENGTPAPLLAPIDDTNGGSSAATPLQQGPPTDSKDLNVQTLSARLVAEEPDGAILHTIAVVQMCFKAGRITIPPAIVFATNGLSTQPTSPSEQRYSHSNPPPHWSKVQEIISKNELGAFYKGGWKSVPEDERWWGAEAGQAFGGVVEETRKERLETVGLLKTVMEYAKDVRS